MLFVKHTLEAFLDKSKYYKLFFSSVQFINIIQIRVMEKSHKILRILILLMTPLFSYEKPFYVNYDQSSQSQWIFKFFYDQSDGYFVDIGAFDPLTFSNTLSLYVKGWNGINVQANPKRFKKFLPLRPYDANLNFAIGNNMSYIILYQQNNGAIATVNEQVNKGSLKNITPINIPSLTMKQLCLRYYDKKPNLMSLDIQNYQIQALTQNDWINPKCRPQILITQKDNSLNKMNRTIKKILEENGYQFISFIGQNQLYIQNQVAEKYKKKFIQGQVVFNQKTFIKVNYILNAIYNYTFNKSRKYYQQTFNTNQPFYYYFPKQNNKVYLEKINEDSNKFTQIINRPILITSYNQQNTVFLVEKGSQTIEYFSPFGYQFINLTIIKKDKTKFSTYIFSPNISIQYIVSYDYKEDLNRKQISKTQLNKSTSLLNENSSQFSNDVPENFVSLLYQSLMISLIVVVIGISVFFFLKIEQIRLNVQTIKQTSKNLQNTISED